MPRKAYYTREQVIDAALGIVREKGLEGLNARDLGKALGVSSTPIFTLFSSMDEVKELTLQRGWQLFQDYVNESIKNDLPYKEYGLRTIKFAQKEPRLFEITVLRRLAHGDVSTELETRCIQNVKKNFDINDEQAQILLEMAHTFSIGIATFMAAGDNTLTDERITTMLGRMFAGTMLVLKNPNIQQIIQEHGPDTITRVPKKM